MQLKGKINSKIFCNIFESGKQIQQKKEKNREGNL